MTKTIQQNNDSYTAYLIPANIHKSTQTNEFQNNFNQNEEMIFNEQKLRANYLTGKKILSKQIPSTESQLNACLINIQKTELNSNTESTTTVTSIKKIENINLSEREGNEYVLLDETNKFNEFINLAHAIHN